MPVRATVPSLPYRIRTGVPSKHQLALPHRSMGQIHMPLSLNTRLVRVLLLANHVPPQKTNAKKPALPDGEAGSVEGGISPLGRARRGIAP